MKPSEAASLLESVDNILIVTHKKPDGDTIGSSSALCHALRRLGKTAYLFKNTEVAPKLLPYCEIYFAPEGFIPDFVVSVDVAAPDMIAKGANYKYDLVIDHHPTNPGFGRYNCVYGERSACGEIVLEIVEKMMGNLDVEEADLLYLAVSTDTGCFLYNNVNAGTFTAASRIMSYGARTVPINNKFFRKVASSRLKLEGLIYSNMEFYHDGKVVVVKITKDMIDACNADEDDLEDIASLAGRLDTEIVGITVRENPDGTSKISMRSTSDVDSSAVCAYFGGGGHKMASGCTIEADVDKAAKILLEVLDSLWTVSS